MYTVKVKFSTFSCFIANYAFICYTIRFAVHLLTCMGSYYFYKANLNLFYREQQADSLSCIIYSSYRGCAIRWYSEEFPPYYFNENKKYTNFPPNEFDLILCSIEKKSIFRANSKQKLKFLQIR